MLHVPYQGEGKIAPNMRDYVVKQLKETVIPTLERISGVKFDIDRLRQYMRESAEGRGRPRRRAAVGEAPAVADRRLLRRRLLHRPDLHRVPRHAGGDRVLPRAAPGDRAARARGQGPGHARRRHGRGEVPARRRRPAQLDQLPRVLEDVLRRRRGRRRRRPTPRSAASTTSASATIPTTRSNRSPNTASAATRTSTCRRAST